MAKYIVLFSFTGETAGRFVAQPSDRSAVVRGLVESAGGSMESYYWMFGKTTAWSSSSCLTPRPQPH